MEVEMLPGTTPTDREQIPRVALNCLSGVAPTNGARVFVLALANALAEIGGLELVLLTAKGEREALPADLQNVAQEVDVPPARSYRQIFWSRRIASSLRDKRVSVLHLPNTVPSLLPGVPTIITIFDLAELHASRYGPLRTVYRWVVNLIGAHMADAVITISQNSKRDIAKHLRINPEKITVTYPGIGEEFVPGDSAESREIVRQRFGTDRFVLFPGGIARNKNLEGALRALAQFRQLGGVQSLLVTGQGEPRYVQSLRRLARRLKVDDKVIWTGCLERDTLPTLYRAADATLYPSFYEGFGMPILESMACGCPVIAGNTSSLPEAAGDAALLVNPRDPVAIAHALKQAVTDLTLRKVLIDRGIAQARGFSWSSTAIGTIEVYRALCNITARKDFALRYTYESPSPQPPLES
ncbi:MAG: glycosyltransferase family 4 protein [Terriglobales bacterium]